MVSTLRRVKQLSYLMFGSRFRNSNEINLHPERRYSSKEEVDFYKNSAHEGLHFEEKLIIEKYLSGPGPKTSALVIGSGCGREAFALQKSGMNVTAIDGSLEMIATSLDLNGTSEANGALSQVRFYHTSFESFKTSEKYDLVFLSSAIAEHIQSKNLRIRFYKKIKECLEPEGRAFVFPVIQKLSRRSVYFWASQILRIRWAVSGVEWEVGDSARAFFGKHNRDHRPVFYHFYPSEKSFVDEIKQVGLEVEYERERAYLLRLEF